MPAATFLLFGAMLYEMLTGKRAFEGKSQLSVASAVLEKDPDSISAVQPLTSPALEHLVRTCLAKEPDRGIQRCARPAHNEDKDFTNRNPYFMPDGKHFLFVQRSATDSGSVYARSLDGSESTRVLQVGSNVAYANGQLFYVKDGT